MEEARLAVQHYEARKEIRGGPRIEEISVCLAMLHCISSSRSARGRQAASTRRPGARRAAGTQGIPTTRNPGPRSQDLEVKIAGSQLRCRQRTNGAQAHMASPVSGPSAPMASGNSAVCGRPALRTRGSRAAGGEDTGPKVTW